jgi:hypothetical protein
MDNGAEKDVYYSNQKRMDSKDFLPMAKNTEKVGAVVDRFKQDCFGAAESYILPRYTGTDDRL